MTARSATKRLKSIWQPSRLIPRRIKKRFVGAT
jgi:hypothetical protein